MSVPVITRARKTVTLTVGDVASVLPAIGHVNDFLDKLTEAKGFDGSNWKQLAKQDATIAALRKLGERIQGSM